MKIKQEASGWPPECDTDEKKRNYLKEYKEHEGIKLDYQHIEKNPGLHSLAKLMLNSFWGKFGQHPNQTQPNPTHHMHNTPYFKSSGTINKSYIESKLFVHLSLPECSEA